MGPLKGKKLWRKSLDASAIQQFVEDKTHQERRGPALDSLKDNELFFIDTVADPTAARGPKKQRKEKVLPPTTAQLILESAHACKPVTVPKRKPVRPLKESNKPIIIVEQRGRSKKQTAEGALHDLWGDEGAPSCSDDGEGGRSRFSRRAPAARARLPAVLVDKAGCSYNPDHEHHQDALAELVASEMAKVLRKELAAPPVPLTVSSEPDTKSELERLQVDEANDEEEEENGLGTSGSGAAQEPAEAEQAPTGARHVAKKSKKDRAKEKRRREEEAALASKRALKAQRNDIDHVRQLQSELEVELAEKERKRQRREVVAAEKAAFLPPILGRHKFEAPGVQVVLSEEVGGGLRRLAPCAMLATERFKSLQQRGLIEPRKPLQKRGSRRVVQFEKGSRLERALVAQKELDGLKDKNSSQKPGLKKMKKQGKKRKTL